MKIAAWNIRDLNKTSKQKEVYGFIREEDVAMFSVLESVCTLNGTN